MNVREAIALLDAIAVSRLIAPPCGRRERRDNQQAASALVTVARKRLADGLAIRIRDRLGENSRV